MDDDLNFTTVLMGLDSMDADLKKAWWRHKSVWF